MRRSVRIRSGVVGAVLVALVSACTHGGTSPTGRASAGSSSQPAGGSGPVLAVKIDNVGPARPQTGVDQADVVYAEQVEGGLSRLMAVYATRLPRVVGPVRSARESDLELLRQFDEPTLAFSGAQSKLLPLISAAPLHEASPDRAPGDAYFRGSAKPAPHNLYLRPSRVVKAAPGAGALARTGFTFGAAPSGGTLEKSRTVRFPSARFTFTWSAGQGRWLVSMDGSADRTTDGRRLAASTVVVQYVTVRQSRFHDVLGTATPYTETVGSGKAVVLRDGRAFDVRWKRSAPQDGTEFTTDDGRRMPFAQGQVWVVLAKR
ncbi:DUF3048 domain-containing protein [Streptomyces sp. NPDC002004]